MPTYGRPSHDLSSGFGPHFCRPPPNSGPSFDFNKFLPPLEVIPTRVFRSSIAQLSLQNIFQKRQLKSLLRSGGQFELFRCQSGSPSLQCG